ncbi:MAG: peptidyl-prolyl cis-trans isomerase [Clostridiales bacterium]|nr:peptidyl-prolyl cis-trans isomerase [Clostridiales bacterium]
MSRRKVFRVNKRITALALAALLAGIAVFASGCDRPNWFPGQKEETAHSITATYVFTIGDEGCIPGEIRVIMADYQREFSSVYGIDMWVSEASDNVKLVSYIRQQSLSDLANIYTMDVVAAACDIELSSNEKSEAKTAASEYMAGLTQDEKSYLDISESELASLFERFALARDLYGSVTEDLSEEISDDEALVMDMRYIVVSDESTASELLEKLDDGEDFDGVATSYSEEDVTDINVDRSTYDEDVTEQLFALNTDEYSQVIAIDGKYYIFYCTNYFDKELTEANKEAVLSEKKKAAVEEVMAQYSDITVSSIREDVWNAMEPDTSLSFDGSSFRELLETELDITY